ncbi:MAG: beta-lactamase family protein, partial [Microbacterium sp.]|nr:beta-lactamase family protein [Microbacterium sp.]
KLIDRDALCRMADQLAASTSGNVHSVLVARRGTLLFERYFSCPDEVNNRKVENVTFDVGTLHDMKSVSKSVASLVVGTASDRGLIRSVDEPILSFFPELSALRSPEKDRLQLAHALTMSLGLKWVEATPSNNYDNDEVRMQMARDPCRYVLGLPVVSSAGQEFFYNTGALTLVSAIVHKATGRPLDEFARQTLFEPLGITAVEWKRVRGDSDAGGGLRLRPRDMAKIGQLVLAGGRWNDRQVVSKTWIETSTAPKLKATNDQSYGYLWWLGRARLNGREVPWVGALGRGCEVFGHSRISYEGESMCIKFMNLSTVVSTSTRKRPPYSELVDQRRIAGFASSQNCTVWATQYTAKSTTTANSPRRTSGMPVTATRSTPPSLRASTATRPTRTTAIPIATTR